VKLGQETVTENVVLLNPFTLLLKQNMTHLPIDEYEISYYHLSETDRQILMQHDVEDSVLLQGHRNHFIVKYLKQFMIP
jgi:hypothetical protein